MDIPLLAPVGPLPAGPALAEALAALAPALRGQRRLTAVLNDPQRHTDSALVLNALAEVIPPPLLAVRVLVACGTHSFAADVRAAWERDLRARLAMPIETIHWHDCRAANLLWASGLGSWRAHPLILEGDEPLLAIGSVEPHYFAGLTGSHKTATIGCADHASIEANHAGAMSAQSAPFALAGNPVFDGVAAMLATLRTRRPVLAVNVLQAGPRILAAAAATDPLEALHPLVDPARRAFSCELPSPADCLVLEVAGPLAGSFYQADKAIKNNENAVRDGGLLVLLAPCPDGIGQDHFAALLRESPDYASAMAVVQARGYRLGDHKAVRLRRLTDPAGRGVRVTAVSEGLSDDQCRLLGLSKAPTVQAALEAAGVSSARDRVFRVRDAGNMVTLVRLPAEQSAGPGGLPERR